MRPSDFVTGTVELLNRLLVVAAAALALLYLVRPDLVAAQIPVGWIDAHRDVLLGCAGAVLLLNLWPLVRSAFRPRTQTGYMLSRSPGGQSRVSLKAVRRSLAAAASSVPDISNTRLKVHRLSPSRIKVVSLYWIPEGENAITLGERLRLVLKRRLAELVALGPKDRVDIQVDLAGVRKRAAAAPAPQRSEAPRRAEGFRGPVYPVDGVEGA